MPRVAREKSFDSIYHIMVRSIAEVDLYKDKKDKLIYLDYMKKAQEQFEFRVYAYCLMDNHAHFVIDANGADISKIMHFINYKYAMYFNKRHERHGHLFQDRFKSIVIKNDRYIYAVTAYVHNNAKAIPGYSEHPEEYDFSSLGVYLGLRQDAYELIDDSFVRSMFNLNDNVGIGQYINIMNKINKFINVQKHSFELEGTEYRSMRKVLVRDISPEKIIQMICDKLDINKIMLHSKYSRNTKEAKAVLVFLLRKLGNYKCADICKILGCVGQSRVSMLSSLGGEIIKDKKYEGFIERILEVK